MGQCKSRLLNNSLFSVILLYKLRGSQFWGSLFIMYVIELPLALAGVKIKFLPISIGNNIVDEVINSLRENKIALYVYCHQHIFPMGKLC